MLGEALKLRYARGAVGNTTRRNVGAFPPEGEFLPVCEYPVARPCAALHSSVEVRVNLRTNFLFNRFGQPSAVHIESCTFVFKTMPLDQLNFAWENCKAWNNIIRS